MRIAVIGLRGFPGIQGGVENHCENIIPRLGDDFHCVVYQRKPYVNRDVRADYKNIEYVNLPSTRLKGVEAFFHTFIASLHIIFHRNADVVNIHNIGPGLFTPLLKIFGYKVVITYHSPNYEHAKWGFFSRTILKIGEFMSLKFADHVIFVNKFQQEKLSENRCFHSTYIPNGINRVTPSASTEFLKMHGIVPMKYILAVGRLTPEKGFDTLIRAVNELTHDYKLVIAGAADNGQGYADTLKQLDKGGRVVFTGFLTGEALRQLYSHARLFVLSSVNEGFPIVLLEALSYNLPVVVTDIPATHLLRLPGAAYTPVGDSSAMAEKISGVVSSSSVDTRIEYPEIADYDWDCIARQTAEVYRGL